MNFFLNKINDKLIYTFLFCIVIWNGNLLIAQSNSGDNDTCKILVTSLVRPDSIVLRWVPSSANNWKSQLQTGYIIERAEIPMDSEEKLIEFEKLSENPIKPIPLAEWAKKFQPRDTFAGIAATLIYTETDVSGTELMDPIGLRDRANDLSMRHSFALFAADMDARVASASGLRWVDKTYKKGSQYLYRIYFAEQFEGLPSDTGLIYINSSEIEKDFLMRSPAITNKDGAIELRWNAGRNARYSAYDVERADEDSEKFIKLNNRPMVFPLSLENETGDVFYTDSLPNYKKVKYRVTGYTAFGEKSKPSEATSGMARDLTPPPPAIITGVSDQGGKKMLIKWDYPESSKDLIGFEIARSANNDGPFKTVSELLPKSARTYLEANPDPHIANFYIVIGIDTAGNKSRSMPFYGLLIDSLPPATPIGLEGYIDTASVVHLKWNLGKEFDLKGYRVYYSNSPDHEFSVLTSSPIFDTVYHDTIVKRTLTKYIYYKVAALDFNFNHSAPCDYLKIRRLDVIPPDCPVFEAVTVRDSAVDLRWFNSSSDDVAEHVLFRRIAGDTTWQELKRWKGYPKETIYTDRAIQPKVFYEYALQATDSSKLVSPFSPIRAVRTFDNGRRPEIDQFQVNFDKENRRIKLSWAYRNRGDYTFLIYRNYNGLGLTKYRVLGGDTFEFIDKDVVGSAEYSYALKAVYKDGGESPVTEIKGVKTE